MEGNRLRCKPSQPPSPAIGPARLPSALHGNCKQMRAALATRRRQRLIGPGPSWRMLDKLGDEVLGCSLELHEACSWQPDSCPSMACINASA
mmetsp:Transcript_10936/g.36267  ORF Transcript_10936/g.36267 Transcript_10936/m.36267 type:complete len:92 (-) Transcript_10936:299-574(-)|eukprot:scaffold18810_cov118-Isochrysis_galbana.AAC.9